ncbi:MAG: citrate transporter [Sphingobacteriia bacterium]|nr:citrate transporter [Sphingobacteriia bacterium]
MKYFPYTFLLLLFIIGIISPVYPETLESPQIPVGSCFPFITLILMIATGPMLYAKFWHAHYAKISIGLGIGVVLYTSWIFQNFHASVHAVFEFISFISILVPLFFASGGILIRTNISTTPLLNMGFLLTGAILSNILGTTGASMVLIRPFMQLNRGRMQAYLIIFFIFFVSNIGGSLTPIGDPPLFLGFIKGVPFTWTLTELFFPWCIAMLVLSLFFYISDSRNKTTATSINAPEKKSITLSGSLNLFWIIIAILASGLDPHLIQWLPSIEIHGHHYSFVREIIQLSIGIGVYIFRNKSNYTENDFSIEPFREMGILFLGIFLTLIPVLELTQQFANTPAGISAIQEHTLFWFSGVLSAFLDNAPTYATFLAASMAKFGLSEQNPEEVRQFALGIVQGIQQPEITTKYLKAISIGSVYFGAMTYIGNSPNFLVKAIAEYNQIRMPSFFRYMLKYSIPFLLPLILLEWYVLLG